ncbi:HlyD family efflux transporter periplasmic adaptor subunit [Burkholderia sp. Ax-1719]|uniref:HlyD family secretion protein n=1 Tax=Burkholderia sp. Ax-1719 TaxID=2608334 RepID=UPI0014234B40|nr:HlyD family efflux transporter periplasmic adaptor subunit [Burkholderia sp. Ax-1719]NIE63216.1 HlyD family efflux transporter periplasmic adaptor subunit [Burkholderia sp. Ax-1719]
MSTPERGSGELELFRTEVYAAQLEHLQGAILLARPPAMWVYAVVALFAALVLVAFSVFGSYTRRETVAGNVASDLAVAKVYPPVEGTVIQRLVTEGERIRVGQPLFILSTETNRPTSGGAESAIARQLALRVEELQGERTRREAIYVESYRAMKEKVRTFGESLAQAHSESGLQALKVQVDERNVGRLRKLAAEGFFSQTQLDDKEADLLNEKGKLAADLRNAVDISTALDSARSEFENAPLDEKNQLSQLDRQIAELREQDISNDVHRRVAITSQIEGVATTPLTDAGDVVSPATLLTSIEPEKARMLAYLYVPSRAIGFVKEGTAVNLRYDAFPYQKFGQYGGHVTEVSRTALPPGVLKELGEEHEGLYRVTVALDEQAVYANGETLRLQDGMKLEADMLLETRKIYEWMLEPLYSLTGRYQTVESPRAAR